MNALTLGNDGFSALFADDGVARAFSTGRYLDHFLAYEIALTQALARVGALAPADAAAAVLRMQGFAPDIARLRRESLADGLPVPAYVRQLKAHVGDDLVHVVHVGTTSQDLIDTALVCALREVNGVLLVRLRSVLANLSALRAAHGAAAMMGRTRMQAALPLTVADRIDTWSQPLEAHLERFEMLRPRLERVQFGGAVGNRALPAGQGEAVAVLMAEAFGLGHAPKAWHAMREALVDYGGWLSLVTGSLGKMGQDLCLMAQQGIDEARFSAGGGSSAMPHKQNPVLAETLVAFARFNAVQVSGLHQALVHEQERSGVAWTLEWMILPAMAGTAARALDHADTLLGTVERLGAASV